MIPTGNAGGDQTPIPSHLQGTTDDPAVEEKKTLTQSSSETFCYKKSKVGGIITVSIFVMLLAAGVVGGIAALAMLDSKTKENEKEADRKNGDQKKKVEYITAGKKRAKMGDLEVAVKLVEYGPLRVKDQTNKVHVSSDPLLQIHFEIRSRRNSTVEYVSWYGNSFSRGNDQVVAELTDQNGKTCDMPVFGDVKGILGHTPKAWIEDNERVQDCVIFELPKGSTITDITEFRLTLPMECFGNTGNIRFKIPQSMINLVTDENGDE